ncbi:MAG TPA: hypothetical protein VJR26_05515 [Candidatus Acidoferrales bacterium]|nr:hypothetical protein [Candidatus Acidoferrales bacterium]
MERRESRVFGLFRDFPGLRLAVESLKGLEFDNREISVLFPEAAVAKTFSADEESEMANSDPAAFIGGALGWLTYVRPKRQGLIAKALAYLGVPKTEADSYERNLREGALLVCIRSASAKRAENAASILNLTGAERVITGQTGRRESERSQKGRAADQLSALAFMS